MPRYRAVLSYDGAGFRGFARQPGIRTVQGVLEDALERLLGAPVSTTCAGRTDAGVHALRQVVSFDAAEPVDASDLVRRLNAILGPEVGVDEVVETVASFDARFSASWRAYRYLILDRPAPDPLRRHVVWHLPEPLDLAAMNAAASHLLGEHDFASFCRTVEGRATVRRVIHAGWEREHQLAVFSIRATSFCHQMVRSLVGFLAEVGRGRFPPERTREVLAARDRAATRSSLAPPHGLILWEVGYER